MVTFLTKSGKKIEVSHGGVSIDSVQVWTGHSTINHPVHGICLKAGNYTIPMTDEIALQIKTETAQNLKDGVAAQKSQTAEFMQTLAGQSWLLTKKMENQTSDL